MIKAIKRPDYLLLISNDPCDVFKFFNVEAMHGLSLAECKAYNNTEKDAYLAGLCNYIPKEKYCLNDPCFVYINATRCISETDTTRLLFHELMHMSFKKHKWQIEFEEQIITWADNETAEIIQHVRNYKLNQHVEILSF